MCTACGSARTHNGAGALAATPSQTLTHISVNEKTHMHTHLHAHTHTFAPPLPNLNWLPPLAPLCPSLSLSWIGPQAGRYPGAQQQSLGAFVGLAALEKKQKTWRVRIMQLGSSRIMSGAPPREEKMQIITFDSTQVYILNMVGH